MKILLCIIARKGRIVFGMVRILIWIQKGESLIFGNVSRWRSALYELFVVFIKHLKYI